MGKKRCGATWALRNDRADRVAVMDGSGQDAARPTTGETGTGDGGHGPRKPVGGRRFVKMAALAATALVGVPLVAGGGLLLAMMVGPVNVSPLLRFALPVTIVGGAKGQPPRGRLDVGQAFLRWTGLRDGLGSPVLLELHDVTILDSNGKVADRIASGAIALDAFPLLRGRIAVTDLQVKDATVALRRDAQGDVDLDLPGEPSGRNSGFPDIDVRRLRRLTLAQTHVTLTDDGDHRVWTVDPLNADLQPVTVKHRHGLTGSLTVGAKGESAAGSFGAHLAAHGALGPDGLLRWHVGLDPVTPAALSSLVPALAAIRTPVGLVADVTLNATGRAWYMTPQDALMKVSAGTGEIDAAGSTLYPAEAGTTLHMTFGTQTRTGWPAHLDVQDLGVQLRRPPAALLVSAPSAPSGVKAIAGKKETGTEAAMPPRLTGSGAFDWASVQKPAIMTGSVSLAFTELPFTEFGQYWPAKAAKGARKWITRNITDGTAKNGQVTLKIGPDKTGTAPDIVGISGGIDAEGVELHWLRPIAPIHGLDAHLDFTSLSTFNITFEHGWQPTTRVIRSGKIRSSGRLMVQPGGMVITDLDKKDQMGTVTVGLAGDLRDHIALLAEPRLHVLSRHPLPFTQPQGYSTVHFTLSLPLISKVTTDDMVLDGHAHVTRVHLGNVAMGRSVDGGTVDMDVTMHGMKLTGKGLFSHIPADVQGDILFDKAEKGQVLEHVVTNLHLTPENVVAAGVPVGPYVAGRSELKVDYSAISDANDQLVLDLDLAKTTVHIPLWSKAEGNPATVHADLRLNGGKIVSATGIRAAGPDLNVNGEARFPAGQPPQLVIPAFRIGRSTGAATLVIPQNTAKPISVQMRAQTLDISPLVEGSSSQPDPKTATTLHVPQAASGRVKGPPSRPWLIDLTADQLYYKPDRALGGVQAFIDHNGVRVDRMRLSMTSPTAAKAEIEPIAGGRRVTIDVPDFGALLSRLAVTDMLVGGHARFEGHFDDTKETAPFSGDLKLSPFVIQHAPGAVIVARSLSIYGWLNAKDPTSFGVTRFEMPVTFADGVMHIHDGRAGNAALGATLEGPVNLDSGTLALSGTVVPVFAINEIPGRIPGLGKLFSPEKGGGLLAVKFRLDGKIDAPDFSISPLTIFLPGVLRNMF
ncbi:AsmA-like C-terminal region-containing protein [Acetobacter conturbans]|uniref:AsmA-like C-terminal domain-containing protein n=1 Tax=Acetobacter conturbans TaxID=1737472 RepID=A0ABX0JZB8_9PROT|nr:AsmA-like C-terminal region-containing protein [Acetobacter conturbans]NHN88380.1 hypothetical protein [Acetobacter conturbans]